MDIYQLAARNKLRFDTPQGALSVEDLFDLPLTSKRADRANLDDVAKAIYRKIQAQGDVVSFVEPGAKRQDENMSLALSIVKDVITVKLAERDAAAKAEENRLRRQRIMEIIERKQDEKLSSASLEELQAELGKL